MDAAREGRVANRGAQEAAHYRVASLGAPNPPWSILLFMVRSNAAD